MSGAPSLPDTLSTPRIEPQSPSNGPITEKQSSIADRLKRFKRKVSESFSKGKDNFQDLQAEHPDVDLSAEADQINELEKDLDTLKLDTSNELKTDSSIINSDEAPKPVTPPTEAQLTIEQELENLELFQADPKDVANLLLKAQRASARNLESHLVKLRKARLVGMGNYRINSQDTLTLDEVVVLLAKDDHLDLVKSLLSSSPNELDIFENWHRVEGVIDDPGEVAVVKAKIERLHSEKKDGFFKILTEKGVKTGDQALYIGARDPDALVDLSKDFWDVHNSDSDLAYKIRDAMQYTNWEETLQQASQELVILKAEGAIKCAPNVIFSLIDKEMLKSEDARKLYLTSLNNALRLVKIDGASNVDVGTTMSHLARFKDPAQALEEVKKLFGENYGLGIEQFEGHGYMTAVQISSDHGYLKGLFDETSTKFRVFKAMQVESSLWGGLSNTIANELLKRDTTEHELATNLQSFHNLDLSVAWRLVDGGWTGAVVKNIDKFKDLDRDAFADEMIRRGYMVDLAINLDAFPNVDHQVLAEELVKRGYTQTFNDHYSKFKPVRVSPELFQAGLNNQYCDFNSTYKLYKLISTDKIPVMDRAARIFGEFATTPLYHLLDQLNSGVTAPELAQLGVSKAGPEGLDQFEQRISTLKADLISHPEDHADLILGNSIVQSLFKRIIRFEESQWGQHTQTVFENIIRTGQGLAPDVRVLSEGFEPSEIVTVATIEGKMRDQERPQFEEDVVKRYQRLRGQLQAARELLQGPQPFSKGIEELRVLFEEGIAGKERALKALRVKNPTKAAELEAEVTKMRSANLRSLKDFEDNFMLLQGDKKLHDKLSTIMFAWALKHPAGGGGQDVYHNRLNQIAVLDESPSMESMSTVIDMVEHVINQESFGTYFTTEVARKAFSGMTSVETLQKALAKSQSRLEFSGGVPLRFEPTRGLLMEFSGHIADACWADKYSSIAKEYPNFTTVTIRQHPEGTNDNLVGAFMLIQADAGDGGPPLLIVRGLNPRENFINRTDVGDFFTKTTDYVKAIASKQGRRAAIVIDGHSGGSGTNRPVLFGYMSSYRQGLREVTPQGKTQFNGYNIDNVTYLL